MCNIKSQFLFNFLQIIAFNGIRKFVGFLNGEMSQCL